MAGRKAKEVDSKMQGLGIDLENSHNSDFHHSLYDLINQYEALTPRLQEIAEKHLCKKWNVPYQNKGLIRFLESMIQQTYAIGGEKEVNFIYKNLRKMVFNSYREKTHTKGAVETDDPVLLDLVNRAMVAICTCGEYNPMADEKEKFGYMKTAANSAVRDYQKLSYHRHEVPSEDIENNIVDGEVNSAGPGAAEVDDPSESRYLAKENQTKRTTKTPLTARPSSGSRSSTIFSDAILQFTDQYISQLEQVDNVVSILKEKITRSYQTLTNNEPDIDLVNGLIKEAADSIRRSKKFDVTLLEIEKLAFLEILSKDLVKDYVNSIRKRQSDATHLKRSRKAG